MKIEHLPEPELEFAGGERHVDIRFGLMHFGPLDRDTINAPRDIRVGIIGTNETTEGVTRWLMRCRNEVPAKESRQPNLFPRFPGFSRESPFGVNLLLDSQLQRVILTRSITSLVAKAATSDVLDDAVNLFIEECDYLVGRAKPDVLVCAPPADLLAALEREALIDDPEDEKAEDVEDRPNSGPDMAVPHRAFHDVLKSRGMRLPVPIQMVRPETYADTRQLRAVRRWGPTHRVQDEATRAWNFHTALYYKSGGTPWRIAREADDFSTCFVGVSFFKTLDHERLLTSVAQVFNALGDGVIVRGGPARIDKDDRQPHLQEGDAEKLLVEALRTYRREHRTMPARVVVHKSSTYNKGELAGFRAAAESERIDSIDLVSLSRSSVRLFRFGYHPPLRGTFLSLDDRTHILYLKGSVDFFMTWPGLYVPRTVEFRQEDTEQTSRFLAQEILALSKQNWNNTQFDGGWPITVRAAREVGAILKHIDERDPIQARYSFYM